MNESFEEANCTTLFDTFEFTKVAIVTAVASALTLLVCLVVIILIIVLKKYKFFSQRLILYITITVVLAQSATVLHKIDYENQKSDFYEGFCVFGGFITQLTGWIWLNGLTSTTIYLFLRVMNKNTERYEWLYFFYIFFFPFLINWIPFIKNTYGKAGVYCWIRSFDTTTCTAHPFGQALQFALFYVPLYVILAVLSILYIVILIKVKQTKKRLKGTTDFNSKVKVKIVGAELRSLVAYPMVFIILSIPLLINRIYSSIYPRQPSLFLWYASGLSIPLQGLITAMIFVLGTGMLREVSYISQVIYSGNKKKVLEYSIEAEAASDTLTHNQNTTNTDYRVY